jgi:hypothetical protein
MTARIGVSVGRLPQEVLLEEFYREGVFRDRAGRTCTCVRIREELPAVFNCSVLTFGVQ